MLLNEFLKEHRKVQELTSVVTKQEAAAAEQQKQIEALTAGLQKVSAQLEASKPAPQVVNESLSSISQSAVTLHRVAAFCFTPLRFFELARVLSVWITLPAGLEMRIITLWHSPAESGGTISGSISRR